MTRVQSGFYRPEYTGFLPCCGKRLDYKIGDQKVMVLEKGQRGQRPFFKLFHRPLTLKKGRCPL